MSSALLGDLTFEELKALDKRKLWVILPVGATEAHGPHLPLSTDVIIAEGMARAGAQLLGSRDLDARIAPPLAYTSAGYAAGFPGTISVQPETATALVVDIVKSLARHGVNQIAIANAHLEPQHIGSLHAAVAALSSVASVVFPDVTRKPWALRLTDEFKSGACHAGQYEGSIVMAEQPALVRDELMRSLPDNPSSLSRAIREGKTSFEAAGGPRAYFGSPASATAAEGRTTLEVLGQILADAIFASLEARESPDAL
ncbi:MAG: creatininase family protein [Myxococcales bacterium]|nr:creatininase family protein [Myxococcales bacterium]